MSYSEVSTSTGAARSRRWTRAAGITGLLLLIAALALLARPSRPERRQVLGLYSRDYATLLAAMALAGAWCLGGLLRPRGGWGAAAGASFAAASKIGGVALVTFAVGEIACRLLEPQLTPYIGGRALAERTLRMVTLNSHGLRDPERPLAKPPGVFRVVVVGDSYMFGQGVPQESTVVRGLERLMNVPGGRPVEVINTARRGYNTLTERTVLDTLGLRFQPDVVLLGYVLNDPELHDLRHPEVLPGPLRPWLGWSSLHYVARAAAHYVLIATGLRPNYTDYIHALYRPGAPGWRLHLEALRGIVRDAHAAGARVAVAVWPLPDRVHAFSPYLFAHEHALAVRAAREAGAEVLDLLPVFARDRYADFALNGWDSHPNLSAHRRAADAIHEFLVTRGMVPAAARGEPADAAAAHRLAPAAAPR